MKTTWEAPPQHQPRQPGIESDMRPVPVYEDDAYRGAGRLEGKRALVTGGDSGIGRAVAIAFAKEGADVAFTYLDEHDDARVTTRRVEELGRRCLAIAGDLRDGAFIEALVARTVSEFGGLDVLVNHAGIQRYCTDLTQADPEQIEDTFRVNILGMILLTRAALPHLGEGASIVNTASITAYRGSSHLVDYASTKGAVVSFTRALASNLGKKGIRVNAVAPGATWTPLIPATFPAEAIPEFGTDTILGRPAQPHEMAAAYVYLASNIESSYVTGQTIHVNGGEIVGG